jgi:hypothetical protein
MPEVKADSAFSQAEQPRREDGADPDIAPGKRRSRQHLVDD